MSGKVNIILREWKLSDVASLAEALNNKNILDNLRDGIPYPYTEQNGKEYIEAMLSADKNSTFSFAVDVGGKAVGSIGIFRQGNIHFRTAELGYYLSEEFWGRGIMTEAIKEICKFVFDNTDIIRIYAEPFAENSASCRVLEKAGFNFEGTMKNNAFKNGKVLDMKLYAITK